MSIARCAASGRDDSGGCTCAGSAASTKSDSLSNLRPAICAAVSFGPGGMPSVGSGPEVAARLGSASGKRKVGHAGSGLVAFVGLGLSRSYEPATLSSRSSALGFVSNVVTALSASRRFADTFDAL